MADERAGEGVAAASGAEGQPLTEELLERLLATRDLSRYLAAEEPGDRSLPDYLHGLLGRQGLRRSDVVRRSGLNPTVVYDIFAGKSRPGRDHAIMLAFGLGLGVRDTQRLLRMAGVSELWVRIRRDAIILWCIEHGLDRVACDDELWRLGERTLLPEGGRA